MAASDPRTLAGWLSAPLRVDLASFWGEENDKADEAAERFNQAVLRHCRTNPHEALAAVERITPRDRRRFSPRGRALLRRTRAHVLSVVGKFREADLAYARAWKEFDRIPSRRDQAVTGIGWINVLSLRGRFAKMAEVASRSRRWLSPKETVLRARLAANHGVALHRAGQFIRAERQLTRARDHFRSAGLPNDAAITTISLGQALLLQGTRLAEAHTCFAEAREAFAEAKFPVLELWARTGLALVDLMEGSWDRALPQLAALEDEYAASDDLRSISLVRRQQAEFLRAVGALEQAERLAARAYRDYQTLGMPSDAAHTGYLHARILKELGRNMDARVRLEESRRYWKARGNLWAQRRIETELAEVLADREGPDPALDLLRPAHRYLNRRDPEGSGVRCRHLLAEILMRQGRYARAIRTAESVYADAYAYPHRFDRPRVALILAQAHAARGDTATALTWADRSVQDLESVYLALGTQALRGQMETSRRRLFHELITVVLQSGGDDGPALALDLLSRARSPQLIEDLLAESGARLQPVRAAIARLRDELLNLDTPDPDDIRSTSLRSRLNHLHRTLSRSRETPPDVVARARRGRRLHRWVAQLEGRPLVFYDRSGETWSAFRVSAGGEVERIPLPQAESALRNTWLPLRLLLEQAAHLPRERRRAFLESTQVECARSLTTLRGALWDPLNLPPGEVLIVPDRELHGVPLEALVAMDENGEESRWIPSRWPHPALVHRPGPRRSRTALLLHDRSEGTTAETRRLARLFRDRGLKPVRDHRRRALEDITGRLRVLHVAAHGAYHRKSWLLNGVRLFDGWLGFEQLGRRQLQNALLFFASCDSALGPEGPGAELGGWMSAGLGAGAGELVLTLWKVDDEAASAFSWNFYQSWCDGLAAPAAAARARSVVRKTMPHPFAWAGYSTVG